MTKQLKAKASEPVQLKASEVALYLAAHPDFFAGRDELLARMQIPHGIRGSVSLLERQISLLREKQHKSRKELDEFLDLAERNVEIFEKSKRLILKLIAAANANEFFEAMEKSFKRDFKCKAYSLIVFGNSPRQVNHFTSRVRKEAAKEHVGALMGARQPVLGALRPAENEYIFQRNSDKVRSAAVLAIRGERNRQLGLLAFGSEDPHYFSSDMDTLFVGFISDTVARLMPRHLGQQS